MYDCPVRRTLLLTTDRLQNVSWAETKENLDQLLSFVKQLQNLSPQALANWAERLTRSIQSIDTEKM